MKKLIALALALVLALSLAACGGNSNPPGYNPGNTNTSSDNMGAGTSEAGSKDPSGSQENPGQVTPSGGSSLGKPGSISDSYKRYTDMKTEAYNNITAKIEEQEGLYLSVGLSLLAVTIVDLSFLPLAMLDLEGGMSALAILGMNDVDVEQKGDSYTITYTNSEGEKMIQTCEYDASTDSARSIITMGGTSDDDLVLEYAANGDGYICQYISRMEEGDYDVLRMYFNGSGDVAIGILTTSAKPDSIYKKPGLNADFALNDSSYFLLEGGILTVLIDGVKNIY